MSDPNVKNITLVSPSSSDAAEGGGTRRRGRKGGKNKTFKVDATREGGGSTSPGTHTQLAASSLPGSDAGSVAPVGVDSPLTDKGAPLQITSSKGGAAHKPMKVVLAAAKVKKGKVILAAAKPVSATATKTRKAGHAKKVRVTISNLGKKIKMAKDIRKAATDSSMDDIKKDLTKAGLVKAGSKAPDAMLRQIYADFMTLKGRAL